MSEGATKLQYALKTLRTKWEEAKEGWQDQVRDDFERQFLGPIETQVEATVRGMEKLSEIFSRVKRDCS